MSDDGQANANGNNAGNEPSRWQPREIIVRGQKMMVNDEAKAVELLQKGARFEEGQRETNQRLKEIEAKEAELEALKGRYKVYEDVDRYLEANPEKAKIVNAVIQGVPIPGFEPDSNGSDPVIAALKGQVDSMQRELNSVKSGLTSGIGGIQRQRTLDAEERDIKIKFGDLATEERIVEARRHAESRGLSLNEAFKITAFDDFGDFTRSRVIGEFGLDPATISPQRGETLSLDGLGPMTPENMERLNADPDLYAKHRNTLRSWRMSRLKVGER